MHLILSVFLNENSEMIAFGQYYLRLNHCHLGRLVVSPQWRGKKVIALLMQALIDLGKQKLRVNSSSLFVLADNHAAIQAYQKFGFVFSTYPEKISLENCLYMIKEDTP